MTAIFSTTQIRINIPTQSEGGKIVQAYSTCDELRGCSAFPTSSQPSLSLSLPPRSPKATEQVPREEGSTCSLLLHAEHRSSPCCAVLGWEKKCSRPWICRKEASKIHMGVWLGHVAAGHGLVCTPRALGVMGFSCQLLGAPRALSSPLCPLCRCDPRGHMGSLHFVPERRRAPGAADLGPGDPARPPPGPGQGLRGHGRRGFGQLFR